MLYIHQCKWLNTFLEFQTTFITYYILSTTINIIESETIQISDQVSRYIYNRIWKPLNLRPYKFLTRSLDIYTVGFGNLTNYKTIYKYKSISLLWYIQRYRYIMINKIHNDIQTLQITSCNTLFQNHTIIS